MNSRPSALPVQMAWRVSRRFAQCAVAAAAGFVMVSLIGCGIVRQSFERIAAKAAVLAEIGVEPLVDPSHFLGRSFIQDLTAGSFFGVTIGLALGIGIFFVCVLVESLPYRKLKSVCMVILCLLLAYLSHRVFRIAPGGWRSLVWLFPAAVAAACEAASPTPIWRPFFPSSKSDTEETSSVGRRVRLPLVLLNAAAAAAIIVWFVQTLPILRYDAASRNFFSYFRDDILLGTTHGKALDEFYYRHTPYATEFIPPTHFQPVIAASCGGPANKTIDLIPRYYTASSLPARTVVIPVHTVPMPDLETAASRFASGAFDVMVLHLSSLGMTFEETEEFLASRSDLPGNWRPRCAIIGLKTPVPNAVRRAIRGMNATDGSRPIKGLVHFGFTRPLLRIFKQPLFPTGPLVVVLWIALLVTACSARRMLWPAASVLISALFAAALWWIVIAGWTERTVLADTLIRFDGPMLSAEEERGLLSSESAEVRYATLRYLTERHDAAHVGRALELLADPDPRIRVWAVYLVGRALKRSTSHSLRGEAVPRIVNALYDESFHVRYAAAESAASAGLHEAEPELMNLIGENEHLYVTWYALNTVHRLRAESER